MDKNIVLREFIEICQLNKVNELQQIVDKLNQMDKHITISGPFRHWTRQFIKKDDVETFKILYSYKHLVPRDKSSLFDTILQHDSLECLKYVDSLDKLNFDKSMIIYITETHVIDIGVDCSLQRYTNILEFLSDNPSPKISEYLIGRKGWKVLYQNLYINHRYNKTLNSFFIKCWESGMSYNYQTALNFARTENTKLVEWILNHIPDYIPEDYELVHRNGKYSYSILRLFCNHNEKEWKALSRKIKNRVDRKRLEKDDYYDILCFPLHRAKLPIYLVYDLLCIIYPQNIHLQHAKSSIKLIQEIYDFI
jgi:hypothetical protein